MPEFVDLTGHKYGKLLVISFSGMKPKCPTDTKKSSFWMCQCDCGAIVERSGNSLRSKKMPSCPKCKVHSSIRHGMWKSREYVTWIAMIRRCHTKTEPSYSKYGARGIRVCDRWRERFENFYEDMGPRPSDKHSLDRINNDGNYEPNNCRWVTMKVQGNNRSTNRMIYFNGQSRSMKQWCEHLNLPYSTIGQRILSGWSNSDALTVPIKNTGPKSRTRI